MINRFEQNQFNTGEKEAEEIFVNDLSIKGSEGLEELDCYRISDFTEKMAGGSRKLTI